VEFLGEQGVAFESVEVTGGAAERRRWERAGAPAVPALAVGGDATTVLHVAQLAPLLGLEAPAEEEIHASGWGLAALLQRWLDHVGGLGWAELSRPTPSRGRSLVDLTVNVFHPVSLLPGAWETGRFDWDPDRDAERERELVSADRTRAYAATIATAWEGFLLEADTELALRNPTIASPRGAGTYAALLSSQRDHAAFHLAELSR
jgi:hypothetical protein